jgi:hypothetical protein
MAAMKRNQRNQQNKWHQRVSLRADVAASRRHQAWRVAGKISASAGVGSCWRRHHGGGSI